jgi:hypothetical protein
MATIPENYNNIRAGIVELLKTTRSAATRNVNALMTATYLGDRAKDRPVQAGRREESREYQRRVNFEAGAPLKVTIPHRLFVSDLLTSLARCIRFGLYEC